MLTSPIQITYDAVNVDLNRVNQDSYKSIYYGKDTTNSRSFTLEISHKLPTSSRPGEAHNVAFHMDHFDSNGNPLRQSAYFALSCIGVQTDTVSEGIAATLLAVTDTNFISDIVGRQS